MTPGLKEDTFPEEQSSMQANTSLVGTLVKLPWKWTDTRAYLSLGGGECQKKLQTGSSLVKR